MHAQKRRRRCTGNSQYDELLGYRFVPGLKVRIPHEGGGYLVKTNGAGFRCNHEATPRKSRARRVLVFGDSIHGR